VVRRRRHHRRHDVDADADADDTGCDSGEVVIGVGADDDGEDDTEQLDERSSADVEDSPRPRRVTWQTPLRDVVKFHGSLPANQLMGD
jgi:hypothetical protein